MICQLNDAAGKPRGYNRMARLILAGFRAAAVLAIVLSPPLSAQTLPPEADPADWPMYNRDLAGTRFSPLHQIDASNAATLKRAWSYNLGEAGGNQAGSEF